MPKLKEQRVRVSAGRRQEPAPETDTRAKREERQQALRQSNETAAASQIEAHEVCLPQTPGHNAGSVLARRCLRGP
jgi:hypothetical protein